VIGTVEFSVMNTGGYAIGYWCFFEEEIDRQVELYRRRLMMHMVDAETGVTRSG
jgi:hypothetical protein